MKALIFLAMAALFAVPVAAADSINPKAEALLWYDAFDGNKPTLLDKIIDQTLACTPRSPTSRSRSKTFCKTATRSSCGPRSQPPCAVRS
jgi:hypothetical protein